ncbi:hypothetical protein AGMMS4952_10890 [Spirochaetia bacterium]|nr:hypothetical protein AGMMS4952_10890 [Spirochaetia bacterium]
MFRILPTALLVCIVASCAVYKEPAGIPLYGAAAGITLYALSRESISGLIPLENPKKLSYALEGSPVGGENLSLELDYRFPKELTGEYEVIVTINDTAAWLLPLDASFLGLTLASPGRFRYALPIASEPLHSIGISLEKKDASKPGNDGGDGFTLNSLGIINRRYGFAFYVPETGAGETVFFATPFVFPDPEGNTLRIEPPEHYRVRGRVELQTLIGNAPGGFRIEAGPVRYNWPPQTGSAPYQEHLFIPHGALPGDPYPILVSGGNVLSVNLGIAPDQMFPESVTADPGLILGYSRDAWRDPRFELFSWDKFPSVLIIDTADYAVQDRLLKRLAFFTEKQGFRGRLAPDAEIEGLHGWNAHDYRAEDLARFFEAARASNFPLLREERELEAILLNAGIIRRENETSGGSASPYVSGEGAIISISRESPSYLRSTFMAHEGFHGIFFIDEDFRDFSRRRWDNLSRPAKRFIRSYFEYQRYDVNDQYLLVNEFMAHVLQQPVSMAAKYFGETLAGRISEHEWRHTALPPKDEATNTWPELADTFSAEAAAFSAYVNGRWGLAAGRTWCVNVRRP